MQAWKAAKALAVTLQGTLEGSAEEPYSRQKDSFKGFLEKGFRGLGFRVYLHRFL